MQCSCAQSLFSPPPLFSHTYTVNNKNTNIATQHTARKHETSIRFFIKQLHHDTFVFIRNTAKRYFLSYGEKKRVYLYFFQVYYMYKFLISNVSFL